MKTPAQHSGTLELINEILSARIRLNQAKNKLDLAEARVLAVKRQRIENEEARRSAQQHVKQARKEFAEARLTLAKMEKNYVAVIQRTRHAAKASRQIIMNKSSSAQAKRPVRTVRPTDRERKPILTSQNLHLPAPLKALLLKKQHFNPH
jgi:hypothetical protein